MKNGHLKYSNLNGSSSGLIVLGKIISYQISNTGSRIPSCIQMIGWTEEVNMHSAGLKILRESHRWTTNWKICAWIFGTILCMFVHWYYVVHRSYNVPCYWTLLVGLQDLWSSHHIGSLHLWHFQVSLPWPQSNKRQHHNKHETHIKVQIQSHIPRLQVVDDKLRYHWTTTKIHRRLHTEPIMRHAKTNINQKGWDSVREMSISSGPFFISTSCLKFKFLETDSIFRLAMNGILGNTLAKSTKISFSSEF